MLTRKTANIYLMMLQVLDDPTGVRIIVNTSYPDFSDQNGTGNAYFMIDRSDANDVYDAETKEKIHSAEVYDHWKVSDSIGQTRKFNSNIELIEFLDSIEGLITEAYMESF